MPKRSSTEKKEKNLKNVCAIFLLSEFVVKRCSYIVKAKYGSDYDPDEDESTDSESAESEDEHGEELTPAVDAAILRTLARIRKKDPEIYDSQTNIFGRESLMWVLH